MSIEEPQGGKQPETPPASGAAGSLTPDTGGKIDASPASQDGQQRSEFIPRERFDQVLEAQRALEAKVAEFETQKRQTDAGTRTWDKIPEGDLQYIVTHSNEYPEHATPALAELRRRDREILKSEILGEVGINEFKSTNNEAFDPNTPLGKEVAKIMSSNRQQKDVLSDVVELANYRIGGNKAAANARTKLIQNMQSASVMAPGSDGQTNMPPPSFMDMPKAEYNKYVENIKLGEFKK